MKNTREIKQSQPFLHWSVALLFLFLTACGGGSGPNLGNQEGVEVSILSSLGSSLGASEASEVETQGVPRDPETGQTGVASAELEVYSGDTRLFFSDGKIVDEAQGQAVTLSPEDSDVSLFLPPGTYTFSLTAFDEREPANVLAKGEVEQQVGEDTRVAVPLTSLLGSARFEAPESVKGNAIFDVFLRVSPPGREDLEVPLRDYTTSYEVQAPSAQLEGATNIGVRVAAACDAVAVTASVANDLSATLNASTSVPVSDEACAGSGNDVGTDLVLPFVSFNDLEDGDTLPQAFTLTGEANDMQSGIDKVEVYEGTVKLGDAALETDSEHVTWSFDYTPEREGNFTFIAVAFDKAGNSSRAEVEAQVDKDDTSTEVVEIPDPTLESLIRSEINKPEGDLTKRDLEQVKVIERDGVLSPPQDTVQNLEGLQFAINLELLDIPFNNVKDLTPLLNNPGLGEGDLINLIENGDVDTCPGSESREIINTLLERGARVFFDEPENCDGEDGGDNGDGTISVTSTSGAASLEGECTLRAAITAANTDSAVGGCPAGDGADTVVLAEDATYTLTEVDNETNSANGLPAITSEITLEGKGATIERGENTPEFRLVYIAEESNLSIDRVTLQGGLNQTFEDGGGGGIFNAGTLNISKSTLKDNGFDAVGAALYNSGAATLTGTLITENQGFPAVYNHTDATVDLENTRIVDQKSESYGLENRGRLSMREGELSGNSDSSCCSTFTNYEGASATFEGTLIELNGGQGSVFNNGGELKLTGVIYRNNVSGIRNGGTLTVTKSVISENDTYGISNIDGATLTLIDSTVSGNGRPGYDASGIVNSGAAEIIRSIVQGNGVGGEDSDFQGVGITNEETGTLTLTESTLTENRGGGVINNGEAKIMKSAIYDNGTPNPDNDGGTGDGIVNSGTMALTNSTVTNNNGIGIGNLAEGELDIAYSTIRFNGGTFYSGIENSDTGTVTLFGTIIDEDFDCSGPITSKGYNIAESRQCNLDQDTDFQGGTDAGLIGPPQDNGGPTFTLGLEESSLAIDAIPTDMCEVDTDQRGVARPQGEACDVGAFERD